MLGLRPRHSIALIAVVSSLAGMSFGSARIIPRRGETLVFKQHYTPTYLQNARPYQSIEKGDLTIKNVNGMYTATWKTKLREFGYDVHYDGSAVGLCKPRGSRKFECNFGSSTGMTNLTASKDGVDVFIPQGQEVIFQTPKKEGDVKTTSLFGNDDENNEFSLTRK